MKNHACAAVTNGYHTDIALKIYSNRILLIITHYKKFGTLIAINRGSALNQPNNSVYSTKVLFGKDDIEVVAAARFIAEQINVDKPLLVSISLKDYSVDTLKTVAAAIKDMRAF